MSIVTGTHKLSGALLVPYFNRQFLNEDVMYFKVKVIPKKAKTFHYDILLILQNSLTEQKPIIP
jgi:hypothetical protein